MTDETHAHLPAEKRSLTARDLREVAGLSYRQLNDWEQKGALPRADDRGARWRRFSAREVFSIAVCAKLRRRFGVPLNKFRPLLEMLLGATTDPLVSTIEQIRDLGTRVWFATDLEDIAVVFPDTELEGPVEAISVLGDDTEALLWLRVDTIALRLLLHIDDSLQIPLDGRALAEMRELERAVGVRSPDELEVLRAIRTREYQTVSISLDDGSVKTIRREGRRGATDEAGLLAVVRSQPFQKVEVQIVDGRIVSTRQKVVQKPE